MRSENKNINKREKEVNNHGRVLKPLIRSQCQKQKFEGA
jgi:hypothetical protein